jgi:hypothetical protein
MNNDNDKGLKQRKIMLWDDGHQRKGPELSEREREAIRRRNDLRMLKPVIANAKSRLPEKLEDDDGRFFKRWLQAMYQQIQKGEELQEAKEAINDYLGANSDLCTNHFKALILFFLKNYINIDPEFAGTPFRKRMENAGEMAMDFIRKNLVSKT